LRLSPTFGFRKHNLQITKLSRAAQAFPHFGPSNASFSPTHRATADHRTIHTAGCYRHVTTNVCTEPRIIRPTQPMRKSLSESAQNLNIDALIPAPNAFPKPAQRLFTGGVPRSNHCRHAARISVETGLRLVRADAALPGCRCLILKQLQNTQRRGS